MKRISKFQLKKDTLRVMKAPNLARIRGGFGPTGACPTMDITCFSECDCVTSTC